MSKPTSPERDKPVDESLQRVPCTVMRGGTSRAVFFRDRDLPDDPEERDRTILSVMGSPHPRQIDGLGGAETLTSKIAIVAPADEADADVRYTFGQVRIDKPIVDYTVSCGNISSAVGYYAVEEGIVAPAEPTTTVRIRETNSGVLLTNELPVAGGRPRVTGDFAIRGVPGTGARVDVGFVRPGGESTGMGLFPTGSPRDEMTIDGETVEYSYVDAGNPYIFVRASDFGCDGTELPEDVDTDEELLARVAELRARLAVESGIAEDRRDAMENKTVVPAVGLVAEPTDYVDYEGDPVSAEEVSILTRLVVDGKLHKAYAGTATVCTGVASRIEGTLVAEYVEPFEEPDGRTRVTVGHPSGTIDALVETDDDGDLEQVAFARTARRLMGGVAYARPDMVP